MGWATALKSSVKYISCSWISYCPHRLTHFRDVFSNRLCKLFSCWFVFLASSLRCYQCDSTTDSECTENFFEYSTLEPEECTYLHNPQYCIRMTGLYEGIQTSLRPVIVLTEIDIKILSNYQYHSHEKKRFMGLLSRNGYQKLNQFSCVQNEDKP